MAKKDKHAEIKKRNEKSAVRKSNQPIRKIDLLELWLKNYSTRLFFSLLFCSFLVSVLLLNFSVSIAGDDSSYIERAWLFLNEGKYPFFQGPAYPILLSIPIKLFGVNVFALKFFSIICQIGFVCVSYFTFKNRVPYIVLFAFISFISINQYILYYSAQTFTETYFLFVQSICLYLIMKIIDSVGAEKKWSLELKTNFWNWLLMGLFFSLLCISKSIAFVSIIAVVIYFILSKNYLQALFAIVSFTLITLLYHVVIYSCYGPNDTNQFEMMLRVNLYNINEGHEDFFGLISRFFTNFNVFVSVHFYRILNIRSTAATSQEVIPALSFVSTLLFIAVTGWSYLKNKYLFFISLYAMLLCAGIFFGVTIDNHQDRLIIVAAPLLFLLLFSSAYALVKHYPSLQFIFLTFAFTMLLITAVKTTLEIKNNLTVLKKNLNGDLYAGFTPDYENYLKLSAFCADSLPSNAVVYCRKPSISFIYGHGKRFLGAYSSMLNPNADSLLDSWKKNNIQYVLLASLRVNPKENNGYVINNIHRMLAAINEKYPTKIRTVKTIGIDEPADLYEINY